MRRIAGGGEKQPVVPAEPVPVSLCEAHRRWAEVLRRIFEMDRSHAPPRRVPEHDTGVGTAEE
ncbi:MAG: hypothetical protein IH965_10035 [Gemmatimonadetes bacterium]|nr:hypothetical protein [Gemmatimonadota bacterium]